MTTKKQRALAGTPTEDLKFEIETCELALSQLRGKGYRESHPAVVDAQKGLFCLTAELLRRENGGQVLADTRKTYMTDGEYLAAGMEPPSRNQ